MDGWLPSAKRAHIWTFPQLTTSAKLVLNWCGQSIRLRLARSIGNVLIGLRYVLPGLFISFFWERGGYIDIQENYKIIELFEPFDVQF